MPITINGDGTITGLAEGGLEDAKILEADIKDKAVAVSKLKDGTDGQIITWDASGVAKAIGPGTDGQVLTSAGAGAEPAFEDLPTSGATLSGSTNNQVVTVTGANAMTGEAGLTFDGTHLSVTDGNVVIATAGHGIDFSATTDESASAASMDSELLDDYEEGEFTPDLTFSTSSTGISYNYRGGRYIKVGNLVHCSAYIFLSSKGSGSGYAEVSLPIQPMNAAPSVTHAQGGFCTESGGWADNKTMVIFRVRGDASKAYVQCNTSSTNHHAYAEIADFTDSTKMIMTFIYRST